MNKEMVSNWNCFTQALCSENYSKPKNYVSHTSNIITLTLKVKKPLKNLEIFSNFKFKINLNK